MTSRSASLSCLLVLALVAGAGAREDEKAASSPAAEAAGRRGDADVTTEHGRALSRGLGWLAGNQQTEGNWEGVYGGGAELATTSLAVLALMGAGHTQTRGEYHVNVREGVKFLLRHATRKGDSPQDETLGYIHLENDEYSKMHAHGYATLALAYAYGMGDGDRREELRTVLVNAVRLIERAQDDSGGWFYEPVRTGGHEGSVTVTQVQALRAARDAGIRVSPLVVEKALGYLERSQDENTGGFCYSLSDRGVTQQSYGLTAAALSTLFGLGQYDRKTMVLRGLRYMKRHFEENFRGETSWFFYANFYAAQTLWQAGATTWGRSYWEEWWPRMRDLLIDQCQNHDGTFSLPFGRPSQDMGEAYRTAFACLILEVPLQILPLYER